MAGWEGHYKAETSNKSSEKLNDIKYYQVITYKICSFYRSHFASIKYFKQSNCSRNMKWHSWE